MNKANIPLSAGRQLLLEEARITPLREFWNGFLLSGGIWRLYWNDAPGAGVILNGEKVELQPDALYVLPPYPELFTFWNGTPVRQGKSMLIGILSILSQNLGQTPHHIPNGTLFTKQFIRENQMSRITRGIGNEAAGIPLFDQRNFRNTGSVQINRVEFFRPFRKEER